LRAGLLLGACAAGTPAAAQSRDALREIAQDQCLVHWQQSQLPGPCLRVEIPADRGAGDGYVVLADRKGGAHFLLIPTRTISGIESADLQRADAPNFFAAAWSARAEIDGAIGRPLPRDWLGMAVNSRHARSQDQLHIHIECLEPQIHAALLASAERLTEDWTPLEVPGWRLLARRIGSATLGDQDPFKLLAAGLPGAAAAMGDYSLLVAGMTFRSGPGFAVLAGTGPGTERLLDSTCSLARP
jgi:CDP-diacylglycerol pyrophosphatase